MERRKFIKQCGIFGMACMSLPLLLESCKTAHYAQGVLADGKLQVTKAEFIGLKNNEKYFRKYILVKPENFNYPVIVYRFSESEYSALLLRCTHQGTELSVNGDLLTCSSHGAEFSNKGEVVQGPADQKLKSFPVNMDENNLYIQLA